MKNFAIIPLKSNSKRVPNKNFRTLKDRPLWRWTLDTLLESNLFENIFLSTDKLHLINIKKDKKVITVERKKELCNDNIHAIEVVFDVVNSFKKIIDQDDNIMLMLPTSPFRSIETIKKSCDMIENEASSVIGLNRASKGSNSYRTFKKETNFLNIPQKNKLHIQSSDLDEYVVTGSIFASKYKNLKKHKTYHQPLSQGIIVSDIEAIDINTEIEFLTAETYAKNFL